MPKGFFITGTDTGVGKTVIAVALIKAAGFVGIKACGMKPIETGCGSLVRSDGVFLKEMAGMDDSMGLITPICFENPLAPLPASKIEHRRVDIAKIKKSFARLARNYEAVIVEGIGGLLVPIKKDYFVLDLARDMGLPLIVVSRPGLGTINHSMLTVHFALKEGLTVAGMIMNYSHAPVGDLAEKTNPEVIKQISPVPLIGVFPYLRNLRSATIEKAAAKNLDMDIIKKHLCFRPKTAQIG